MRSFAQSSNVNIRVCVLCTQPLPNLAVTVSFLFSLNQPVLISPDTNLIQFVPLFHDLIFEIVATFTNPIHICSDILNDIIIK